MKGKGSFFFNLHIHLLNREVSSYLDTCVQEVLQEEIDSNLSMLFTAEYKALLYQLLNLRIWYLSLRGARKFSAMNAKAPIYLYMLIVTLIVVKKLYGAVFHLVFFRYSPSEVFFTHWPPRYFFFT